ncbi:MAG: endonuclease domain-containing protein [Bacteroidia bacterium]|nr:endonuclease domain-containing protein [Bacteroidia bacterium]
MVYIGKSVERDMYYGAKPDLFRLAERMRRKPTTAENILWKRLRVFRRDGFIFRRQHPIEFFIADFYCHKIKLVIEVDGEIHSSEVSVEYDDSRSGEIERFGIKVIRFKNVEVLNNVESVIGEVRLIINELSSPSLLGEGD